MAAMINKISSALSLELNGGIVDGKQVTYHNTVGKLDLDITPDSMANLKTILAAFIEYPVQDSYVKTTGLLIDD